MARKAPPSPFFFFFKVFFQYVINKVVGCDILEFSGRKTVLYSSVRVFINSSLVTKSLTE